MTFPLFNIKNVSMIRLTLLCFVMGAQACGVKHSSSGGTLAGPASKINAPQAVAILGGGQLLDSDVQRKLRAEIEIPLLRCSLAQVGQPYSCSLPDKDSDQKNLTYACLSHQNYSPCPSWLNLSQTGTLTGIPQVEDVGQFKFLVRVSNAQTSLIMEHEFTVKKALRAPILNALENYRLKENGTLTFQLKAVSPDGDKIFYGCRKGCPRNFEVDTLNGGVTFKPNHVQAGVYKVVLEASNGVLAHEQSTTIQVDNSVQFSSIPALDDTFGGLGFLTTNDVAGRKGVYYVATDNGLSITRDFFQTFTTKRTEHGFVHNGIRAVAVHTDGTVYVTTAEGLSFSKDEGQTWTNVGTAQGIGVRGIRGSSWNPATSCVNKEPEGDQSLSALYVSPLSGRIFVGTDTSGVSLSKDGGRSFTAYNSQCPNQSNNYPGGSASFIGGAAVGGRDVIFASEWGNGFFFSLDGGETWYKRLKTELVNTETSAANVLDCGSNTCGISGVVYDEQLDRLYVSVKGGLVVFPQAKAEVQKAPADVFKSALVRKGPQSGAVALGQLAGDGKGTLWSQASGTGVVYSLDGGESFSSFKLASHILGDSNVNRVRFIDGQFFATSYWGLYYGAARDGAGVVKTTSGNGVLSSASRILFDERDGGTLVVSGGGGGSLFWSRDMGKIWASRGARSSASRTSYADTVGGWSSPKILFGTDKRLYHLAGGISISTHTLPANPTPVPSLIVGTDTPFVGTGGKDGVYERYRFFIANMCNTKSWPITDSHPFSWCRTTPSGTSNFYTSSGAWAGQDNSSILGSDQVRDIFLSPSALFAATSEGLSWSTDKFKSFKTRRGVGGVQGKTAFNDLSAVYFGSFAGGARAFAGGPQGVTVSGILSHVDDLATIGWERHYQLPELMAVAVAPAAPWPGHTVHFIGAIDTDVYFGGLCGLNKLSSQWDLTRVGVGAVSAPAQRPCVKSDRVNFVKRIGARWYVGTARGLAWTDAATLDEGTAFQWLTAENGLGSSDVLDVELISGQLFVATSGGLSKSQ